MAKKKPAAPDTSVQEPLLLPAEAAVQVAGEGSLPAPAPSKSEHWPEPPAHFTRKNSRGLFETVCLHTGRVLLMQPEPKDILEEKFDRLVKIETKEGPVYLEKSLNFDVLAHIKKMPYSRMLSDLICEGVFHGKGLAEAGAELNIDYSTLVYWQRHHAEFREAIRQAELDAAKTFFDESIAEARGSGDSKLKVDTLMKAAEKNNPEKYGTKTKIVGDRENPVAFVFNTGIDRSPEKPDDD